MTVVAELCLALALVGASTHPPEPTLEIEPTLEVEPTPAVNYERRARRLFIAGGVIGGLSLLGEATGAIVSTLCQPGTSCTVGLNYTWGSPEAGTRYTLIGVGTGSAYVMARALSIPLVWTSSGLLLAGTDARARADSEMGWRPSKRLAWGLLGSGLGIYVASRLARLGFALAGVCQAPRCVYAFDQLTLGVSRGLSFSGSALVLYRHTRSRLELGLTPTASLGLAVTGRF